MSDIISYVEHPEAFTHEHVLVEHGDLRAWIDRKISILIKHLWKSGFRTQLSCEEIHPGIAFIVFEPTQAARFCRRLIELPLDREVFERLDRERSADHPFLWDWQRGFFPIDVPVWTRLRRNDVAFPLAYLAEIEKAAGSWTIHDRRER